MLDLDAYYKAYVGHGGPFSYCTPQILLLSCVFPESSFSVFLFTSVFSLVLFLFGFSLNWLSFLPPALVSDVAPNLVP